MKKIFLLILLSLLLISLVNAESLGNYPDSLDYRDYMGQNWMTPVKNQEQCGSCWAFSAVGSIEGQINLFYNQQLDVDLSEQQLVSNDGECCEDCGDCAGGGVSNAYEYLLDGSLVLEDCFPYQAENIACNICENPENAWNIGDLTTEYLSPYSTKSSLFKYGPGGVVVGSWGHAMVFTGYTEDDNLIIKNSWGEDWGEEGYVILNELSAFGFSKYPYPTNDISVYCSDNDNDDYCYWGKSEDTTNCSNNCVEDSEGNLIKDLNDDDFSVNLLKNVWIDKLESSFNVFQGYYGSNIIFDSENLEKIFNLTINFSGYNNLELSELQVNFYIDNILEETRFVNAVPNQNFIEVTDFTWTISKLQYTILKFEIIVSDLNQETQGFSKDNVVETEIWVYNYDEPTIQIIYENNLLIDCDALEQAEIVAPKPSSGTYLELWHVNNATIKNCILAGFNAGFDFSYSENLLLTNNSFSHNGQSFDLGSETNNVEIKNNIMNHKSKINIWNSHNISIVNNSICFTKEGIIIKDSTHFFIIDNNLTNSSLEGILIENSDNFSLINNNINNNGLEGILIENSDNFSLINNNINNSNKGGIKLHITNDGTLINNNIIYSFGYLMFDAGLSILLSHNTIITNNRICDSDTFMGDVLCAGSESTSGYGNNFGEVSSCADGWPAYNENYLYCNEVWITCDDGTMDDSCSDEQPFYCVEGELINNCQQCGCSEETYCQLDGTCANTHPLGDVDGNGVIDSYDVALVLRYSAEMIAFEDWQLISADVDCNEVIESFDSSFILQYITEIIDEFPCNSGGRYDEELVKKTNTCIASIKITSDTQLLEEELMKCIEDKKSSLSLKEKT